VFKDKLKGKILVVFSDPGGAKPCLSICDTIDKLDVTVLSDRDYSFYGDFNSKVNILKDENEIGEYIDRIKPDILFTGTSYTSSLEKTAVKLAKKKGILTFSFVDHWTSISDRFIDEEGSVNFPNEVWVLDERANQIAIDEGIPKDKLFIAGNPYHKWLKRWDTDIKKEDFFNSLELDETKKHILFAPDPLSNVNGIEKFGFDEYIASKKMVECVENSSEEFKKTHHFLIKMHPNQSVQKLIQIFEGQSNFTILPQDIDTNLSIYFSDIVIGFFSSLLIEANVMNKPIIRFLENELKFDPFLCLNVGTITSSKNLVNNILIYSLKNE
jgi:hypothetical protein